MVSDYRKHCDELNVLRDKAYDIGIQNEKSFGLGDVRVHFFGKMLSVIDFYRACFELGTKMEVENREGIATCDSASLSGFVTVNKAAYILGCWSCFESSLDLLYKAISSEDDRERIELKDYNKIRTALNKCEINSELLEKLKKIVRIKHVPITDKYNLLYERLSDTYKGVRDRKKDKLFLGFFGASRNAVHNNFHSGSDLVFNTRIGEFKFERNKPIDFFTEDLLIQVANELIDIFHQIVLSLPHVERINDIYLRLN